MTKELTEEERREARMVEQRLYEAGMEEELAAWPEPVPFDTAEVRDFPATVLPPAVGAMVTALAESTQTPVEMAGLLSLGVLAAALQDKFTLEVTPDWREPLCLYTVAVAPPGERKSAVLKALTEPLYLYEDRRRKREAAQVARSATERAMLERALEGAKTAAARGKKDGDAQWKRAMELSDELAGFEELYPYRLLVDDTTPEKLAELMSQQHGCIAVCSAEGGVFDAIQGRYSTEGKGSLDVYLKAHAGDELRVDRMTRKGCYIPDPRMTVMLTVQPQVLTGLMNNAAFRGRGLCGRFLYAMCRSRVGQRESDPAPIPRGVRERYRDGILRLLEMEYSGIIRLSDDARTLRQETQSYVEYRLGDQWEHMRDWGGKLVGAILRVAALIHAATVEGDPTETPISPDTLAPVCGLLMEFLATHAQAAYQVMGGDSTMDDARYLWKRLKPNGGCSVTRRDFHRICRGRFRRAEDMTPGLRLLESMGYIKEYEEDTGGRPALVIVNNPRTWYRRRVRSKSEG